MAGLCNLALGWSSLAGISFPLDLLLNHNSTHKCIVQHIHLERRKNIAINLTCILLYFQKECSVSPVETLLTFSASFTHFPYCYIDYCWTRQSKRVTVWTFTAGRGTCLYCHGYNKHFLLWLLSLEANWSEKQEITSGLVLQHLMDV